MGYDDTTLHDFVAARFPALRRSAFLMCGDWTRAEEQTRTSLAHLIDENHRAGVEDYDAYVYAHLMAAFQHRPPRREHVFVAAAAPESPTADPAGSASVGADPLRTVLVLDALHKLTPRCRAVLVLRHWEGFEVDETADVLGLADNRVEAYEAAGLAALEALLPVTEALAAQAAAPEPAAPTSHVPQLHGPEAPQEDAEAKLEAKAAPEAKAEPENEAATPASPTGSAPQ